jgi:hypothetical protein
VKRGKKSMSSEPHLAQPFYWRLAAAFLLGIPVGFLFRPFSTENASLLGPIPPVPPILSLWGIWQFPVLLFFSIMLSKTIYTFIWKRGSIFRWKMLSSLIVLLISLLLFICGIAPEEQLRMMGLYWNMIAICYLLLNPFVVGLAASFILEDTSKLSFSPGKAILIAGLSWAGTVTLFLILVYVYAQVVSPLCFHWFCTINIILYYAPVWICIGLMMAMVGGSIGGSFCHFLLVHNHATFSTRARCGS